MDFTPYIPDLLFALKVGSAALFGLIFSLLLDIHGSGVEYKNLVWSEWKAKNFWRVIVAISAIIAGLVFTEDLLGVPVTPFLAFSMSFSSDRLVNDFVKRRSKIITRKN